MDDFLAASLSFPTVVFTVLLLIALAYWLLVIIGALGLDALDFDHDHAGGADVHAGDVGGHGDVHHGDVHHGDAHHGDAHHGHDHGHTGEGLGLLPTLLWVLKLNSVPMTIVLSSVLFWSWLTCHLAMHHVVGYDAPRWVEIGLFFGALALSLPLTSLAVRPIAPLFRSPPAQRRSALIGKIVDVDTSYVSDTFGLAKAEDGGAGLIVQIRSDATNGLKRGDRALVLSFDEAREVYEVTPIDDLIAPDKNTGPNRDA